jgi:SAM-dependent methyltransferase
MPTTSDLPSFRDPAGRLFRAENRILRAVTEEAWARTQPLLESSTLKAAVDSGQWIPSTQLAPGEAEAIRQTSRSLANLSVVLEHPRVEIPTFPYEWIPEMLFDAATLTLDLSLSLAQEGAILKDATPFNVLFRGHRPVWVDVTSVEPRNPLDPTWAAYGQFHRAFLLPLLALRDKLLTPAQIYLANREGLEPESAVALAGPWRKLRSPWFSLATMPSWFSASAKKRGEGLYQPRLLSDPAQAQFVLERVLHSLRKQLNSVKPAASGQTVWSDYVATTHDADYYARRERMVEEKLAELRPKRLLDVGANTGRYSIAAAKQGAHVVSLDLDSGALAKLYAQAKEFALPITPVLGNLAHPSPATGWRNQECAPLLARLEGQFDGVFMLAVLHHLLVTERVPMPEVAALAASLTRDWLLIEYIAPHDDLFRQIARGRDALYEHLTKEHFTESFARHFDIANCLETIPGRRWLYLLRKRP